MATSEIPPKVQEGVEWLRSLSRAPLQRFTVHLPPVPTPRPTVNRRGGVFYRGNYPEYSAELKRSMTALWEGHAPLDGELGVLIDFRIARAGRTKLLVPPGDVDNYLKGALDALKPAAIVTDDVQFTIAVADKRFVDDDPGFTMWVAPLREGLGL